VYDKLLKPRQSFRITVPTFAGDWDSSYTSKNIQTVRFSDRPRVFQTSSLTLFELSKHINNGIKVLLENDADTSGISLHSYGLWKQYFLLSK